MKVKIPTPGILLVLATSIIALPVRGALATLVPVRNGEPFVTLLNFSLDPNFDANAPAPPVVTDTDNPIVAVYDSEANVTWMSDQHLFQEQYNANVYCFFNSDRKESYEPRRQPIHRYS